MSTELQEHYVGYLYSHLIYISIYQGFEINVIKMTLLVIERHTPSSQLSKNPNNID